MDECVCKSDGTGIWVRRHGNWLEYIGRGESAVCVVVYLRRSSNRISDSFFAMNESMNESMNTNQC